jgi:hypothetical protein
MNQQVPMADASRKPDGDTQYTSYELGMMLANRTRKVTRTCLECGTVMKDVTVRRAFCAPACKQKNWRDRSRHLAPYEPTPPASSSGR